MTPDPGLLTVEEQAAVQMCGDLWGLLCKITGEGPTRDYDLSELVTHVHALQNAVLSQAAARAYPGRYRALGLSLAATDG